MTLLEFSVGVGIVAGVMYLASEAGNAFDDGVETQKEGQRIGDLRNEEIKECVSTGSCNSELINQTEVDNVENWKEALGDAHAGAKAGTAAARGVGSMPTKKTGFFAKLGAMVAGVFGGSDDEGGSVEDVVIGEPENTE